MQEQLWWENIRYKRTFVLWEHSFCGNIRFVGTFVLWEHSFCENIRFVRTFVLWEHSFWEDIGPVRKFVMWEQFSWDNIILFILCNTCAYTIAVASVISLKYHTVIRSWMYCPWSELVGCGDQVMKVLPVIRTCRMWCGDQVMKVLLVIRTCRMWWSGHEGTTRYQNLSDVVIRSWRYCPWSELVGCGDQFMTVLPWSDTACQIMKSLPVIRTCCILITLQLSDAVISIAPAPQPVYGQWQSLHFNDCISTLYNYIHGDANIYMLSSSYRGNFD